MTGRGPVTRGRVAGGLAAAVLAGVLALPSVAFGTSIWLHPVKVDSVRDGNVLTSVSCPAVGYCVAVDDGANRSDGHWLAFHGHGDTGTWTSPAKMDPDEYGPVSVSCLDGGSGFCAAVDGGGSTGRGGALTYTGMSWGSPVFISDAGLSAVSCTGGAAAPFCAAVNESAYLYRHGSWGSSGSLLDGGIGFGAVSCPTASFCAAVGGSGAAVTYNGSAWTVTPRPIDTTQLTSVSCPSASFCMAVDVDGRWVRYNGASWTTPAAIDPKGQGLSSVSCRSSTFCVAVDGAGHALRWGGQGWRVSRADPLGQGFNSVSCASVSFCMALDNVGDAVEYGPAHCHVPRLRGLTVRAARAALLATYCRSGSVTRRASSTVAAGRVISSRPSAGTNHPPYFKVNLIASSGKPRRRR
jgi:hypothetical protein